MKMHQIGIVATLFFVLGCSTAVRKTYTFKPVPEKSQTPEQKMYLQKYCDVRKQATSMFGLPDDASPEDIRARAVPLFLGLSSKVSWEEVLAHKVVQSFLTEERRQKFSLIFFSHENASWIDMLADMERRRKERKRT